jgi:pimeloyl-ACP methyl ester carboxylesterase
VEGFVALCTGPGALPPHRHGGLSDLVDALPHTDMDAIWAIMRAEAEAAGKAPADPQVRDFLRRRWLGNDPHQIREFAHQLMTAPAVTAQMRDRVSAGLPVTVMWGELDDAWPTDLQARMANDWGARAVQLDGAGHSPNAQLPVVLVEALLAAWHG